MIVLDPMWVIFGNDKKYMNVETDHAKMQNSVILLQLRMLLVM